MGTQIIGQFHCQGPEHFAFNILIKLLSGKQSAGSQKEADILQTTRLRPG